MKNKLYFGDNLEVLRDKIPSESVELIYLDPPFKSGKTYNFIFEPELIRVKGATAQHESFGDTWKWGEKAEEEYQGLISNTITIEKANQELVELVKAMRSYLGEVSMMAYLCMMAPRLLEMKRVLKKTGSIYLHCDPTASHYLKLLMDAIFGVSSFRNEIIWHYRRWTGTAKLFLKMHDILFFYTKTDCYTFNQLLTSYTEGSVHRKKQGVLHRFKKGEEPVLVSDGEVQSKGVPENDVWHIPFVAPSAKERIGYPTQKPEALLERIVKASSNEGDVVCDPFCGCGTAIAVAERLNRRWIGIDVTPLAIKVIKSRLMGHDVKEGVDFEEDGIPKDVLSAEELAKKPDKFEEWCVLEIEGGTPCGKTGDKGVDGIINFIEPTKKNKAGKGVIQVKGTDMVSPAMVRELKGTLKGEEAEFAILITKKKPTRGMITAALKEGYYHYKIERAVKKIPRIQLLWVGDLFKDPMPVKLPSSQNILPPYKQPVMKERKQGDLF